MVETVNSPVEGEDGSDLVVLGMGELGTSVVLMDSIDSLVVVEAPLDSLAMDEVMVRNLVVSIVLVDTALAVEVFALVTVVVPNEDILLIDDIGLFRLVIAPVGTFMLEESR